jgi:hypothetical protein
MLQRLKKNQATEASQNKKDELAKGQINLKLLRVKIPFLYEYYSICEISVLGKIL